MDELKIEKATISRSDVLSRLNSHYDIFVHIGHGKANRRIPKLTSIELTVKDKDEKNQTIEITLSDFRKVNWNKVKLAALIGCETGIGKIYKGTGASGLQQCMLSSGANEIIASLWTVDARTSIDLMSHFFRFKNQHTNSAIALQQAQIESIRILRSKPYFQGPHPYFWSGFTITQKSL